MHYPIDYEYPLYKRTPTDYNMQVVPKGAFRNRQTLFVEPQKFIPPPQQQQPLQVDYEPRYLKQNAAAAECAAADGNEYYYQKELHNWEKNCNCGILTSEYRSPVEYQPMIAPNPSPRMPYPTPHCSQNNISSGIVPSYSQTNTDDFPPWLKIYSRASIECDHKLHWDMFNIRDLCFFENVMVKLYELDLEEIILWYKCYKNALLKEMDKRLLEANHQRQMILLYNS